MIDITPYQRKLELLKEFIGLKIENDFRQRMILRIWETTGNLLFSSHNRVCSSFDEYCNYKLTNK